MKWIIGLVLLAGLETTSVSLASTSVTAQAETPAGTYTQTCSSASVRDGRLYATCLDMRGRARSSWIDLAPCTGSDIGNDDGLLVCHGVRGTPVAPVVAPPRPVVDLDSYPSYGSFSLRVDFYPDPQTVSVRSGGDVDAAQVAQGCVGFIPYGPTVEVTYEAGRWPLIFSVDSQADTTLVINGPDGRWYCDDDGGKYASNPSVRFVQPLSGVYDVWVGSYERYSSGWATLHISETSTR